MHREDTLVWEPNEFTLQTSTVWSFPERGNWATHNSKYRGNWAPQIPRNVILRYSRKGDWVLDQFVGGGTTLIESKLLGRNAIGVDINPEALKISKGAIGFSVPEPVCVDILSGDARNLLTIEDSSIDLICTHPPYSNIVKYSEGIDSDLSLLGINEYLVEMEKVAKESYRVLKNNKYCAILIGDTRKNGSMIPLGFMLMRVFESASFKLKEIVIKEQHNCTSTGFWRTRSEKLNFLLIAHEYLFIFRK